MNSETGTCINDIFLYDPEDVSARWMNLFLVADWNLVSLNSSRSNATDVAFIFDRWFKLGFIEFTPTQYLRRIKCHRGRDWNTLVTSLVAQLCRSVQFWICFLGNCLEHSQAHRWTFWSERHFDLSQVPTCQTGFKPIFIFAWPTNTNFQFSFLILSRHDWSVHGFHGRHCL